MGTEKVRLNRKQQVLGLFIAGAILILAGIILWAVLVPRAEGRFYKVMSIMIFVAMILLGGSLLVSAYLRRVEDAHFFRYDVETERNIPLQELDFDRVNRRMSAELRVMVGEDILPEIWLRRIFQEEGQSFGKDRVLAPLVAYKMLYDLARYDRDDYWELFTTADPNLVKDISAELERAGEERMARALIEIYDDCEGDSDIGNIRDFLTGNIRYLRRRMVEYARDQDENFY